MHALDFPFPRSVGPVLADEEAASLTAPSFPDATSTLAFLSGRPWAAGAVAVAWVTTGVAVALALGRRGHDAKTLGALGILFGPLLLGLARASILPRESTAEPIELDPGLSAGGGTRVLVAVLASPADVADVLPVLRTLGAHLGEVTLARPVSFESVEDPAWDGEKEEAARALSEAAAFLADIRPRLLLVPGRGDRAIVDLLRQHEADVAIAVGTSNDLAVVCRHLGEDRTAMVICAGDGDGSRPSPR